MSIREIDQVIMLPDRHIFQPSWGPINAMAWLMGLYASTMFVAFAAESRGLIVATHPDGSLDVNALMRVAVPLQIVGVLIVASRLRSNPLDVLALRLPGRLGRFILIALALMAVIVALGVALFLVQDFVVSHGGDVPADKNQTLIAQGVRRDGLLSSLMMSALLVPLQEEMMFRGLLLLSFFHTRLWFWGAAFLTSLLFALAHNSYSTNIFLHAPYVIMGLAFALALRLTGSLWVPIGMHSLKNSIAVLLMSQAAVS